VGQTVNNLTIVSHVVHYQWKNSLYAYGPYTREIELWADLFPQVIIAAPCRNVKPPSDCLPLERENIQIVPQLERGGDTWQKKLVQVLSLPLIALKLVRVLQRADAIQVRCPGNLGLLGVMLAPLFSRYRVAKYAGQWIGYPGESLSNRLQRYILSSNWWKSPVLVYGRWPKQPKHIIPFFTSMMSDEQVEHAQKLSRARDQIHQPLRLLYSGRLVSAKRINILIDCVKILIDQGLSVTLKIVGDGPLRNELEAHVGKLNLSSDIQFEGAFPYNEALRWNEWADCLVLASRHSEGWPKVVAEAMCYGVIPIVVNHGQLPEMINGRGYLLSEGTPQEFAETIVKIISLKNDALEIGKKASIWAAKYSLSSMGIELRSVLTREWSLKQWAN
jgi:glycosyltransferase involved in cell wall biosynthesis